MKNKNKHGVLDNLLRKVITEMPVEESYKALCFKLANDNTVSRSDLCLFMLVAQKIGYLKDDFYTSKITDTFAADPLIVSALSVTIVDLLSDLDWFLNSNSIINTEVNQE